MKKIQLDMFEVQLGAAILIQFWADGSRVSVLADAGIKASGYPQTHVRDRLKPILQASGNSKIDLIIGTHYDEDHLNGLVPIIEDESIAITEAWLPPVANDRKPHALDAILTQDDLLATQFAGETAEQVLSEYIVAERRELDMWASILAERPPETKSVTSFAEVSVAGHIRHFRERLANLAGEDDCFHGSAQELESDGSIKTFIHVDSHFYSSVEDEWHWLQQKKADNPDIARAQMRTATNMQIEAAKRAINAKALYDVVQALKKRKIPIRSEIIEDGEPKHYSWRRETGRFVSGSSEGKLRFALLGPSRGLVRKHWDKLPEASALRLALRTPGELKSITPSNQLSYIGRFEFEKQGILISGDAGCVDFKPDRQEYYPNLLKVLLPLHVIQIAHHAGNNAHFYRVLEAAKFPAQSENSLLLLSHATHDKHRPSPEFGHFVTNVLANGDDTKLLFTSEPSTAKVADYRAAIHHPVGPTGKVGDISIAFERGRWDVEAHAIKL